MNGQRACINDEVCLVSEPRQDSSLKGDSSERRPSGRQWMWAPALTEAPNKGLIARVRARALHPLRLTDDCQAVQHQFIFSDYNPASLAGLEGELAEGALGHHVALGIQALDLPEIGAAGSELGELPLREGENRGLGRDER